MNSHRLDRYVSAVIAIGAAMTIFIAVTARVPTHVTGRELEIIGFLVLFLAVGELLPIQIRRGDSVESYTFSGTAALALIITGPLWVLAAAQLAAALVDDLRNRRPLKKLCFNLGQYSLTLVIARLVYTSLSGRPLIGHFTPHFVPGDVVPALVAGFTYFLVNICLVAVVFALAEDAPTFSLLPEFLKSEAPMALTLLAAGPIILAALEFSPAIAPLCLLPVLAVRAGALNAAKRELQALHDALTGLPNRTLLMERMHQALRSVMKSPMVAMILIDLDRFKEINDAMGHSVGDDLLRKIAAKLSDSIRPEDTVARLGGDEFAVLCPHVPNERIALDIGNRAIAALTGPIDLEGVHLHLEASAGIALSPLHGTDVGALMQRADIDLYRAKGSRRGSVVIYDESFDENSIERLTLMAQLRQGLEDELVVYYQPKCRLSDGAVVGVEALVRWQHPKLGLMPPASFLDAAEKSGLMIPLTVQVFRQVLDQWRSWKNNGLDLSMAVNVSAASMCDPTLPDELGRVLEEMLTPGDRLLIELTETAMVTDLEVATGVLTQLRAMGLDISIDDFGTGHSSLANIRDLGPVEVKIDRSFVASSPESDRDLALLRATTELGHGLGMTVVAEGVETSEQLELVAEVGCDLAQGFFILPPVAADELVAWASRPQVWSRHIATAPALAATEAMKS